MSTELEITPQEAADLLSNPSVKVGLMGWIESNCQVKTLALDKPAKGRPYKKTADAARRTRDSIEKTAGELIPNGIVRFTKCSVRNLVDYQQSVNNAREREGKEADFESNHDHPFADPYRGSRLIRQHRHNGRFYLVLALNQKSVVKSTAELRDNDGNPLEYDSVWQALQTSELKEERAKKNEDQAEQRGLSKENDVKYRNFALDNVVRFCYANRVFRIVTDTDNGDNGGGDLGQTVERTDEAARIFAEIHATLKGLVEKVEKIEKTS